MRLLFLLFISISFISNAQSGLYNSNANFNKVKISTDFIEEATNITENNLSQNYPNPFNPVTKIKFSLKEKGIVILRVYNVIGREVCDPYKKELDAGVYEYTFNMKNLPSGIYFYKITTNSFVSIRKMILIK
jgi:hypothetical protein